MQALVASRRPATWAAIDRMWRAWRGFCAECSLSRSVWNDGKVVHFLLYHFHERSVSAWSSACSQLATALWLHGITSAERWPAPLADRLRRIGRGMKNQFGVEPARRPPVRERTLQAMYARHLADPENFERLREWTMVLFGTVCLLRVGELAAVRLEDIDTSAYPAEVRLRKTKTGHLKDTGGDEKVRLLSFPAKPWLDTVSALNRYFVAARARGHPLRGRPLFASPTGALSWNGGVAARIISRALQSADPIARGTGWGGHSMRPGGLLLLVGLGFSESMTRVQGRWSSEEFMMNVYWRGGSATADVWASKCHELGLMG